MRVERAVSALPGVDVCAVSLLTNSMRVEGAATDDAIVSAVEKAGYGCKLKIENGELKIEGDGLKTSKPQNVQTSDEVRGLRRRLG